MGDSKYPWFDDDNARLKLNVSGREFVTKLCYLCNYPDTLLGDLQSVRRYYDLENHEFFFARQPTVFASVLDLYHGGELHLPKDVCEQVITEELRFWRIERSHVEPCCAFWLGSQREERAKREEMRDLFDLRPGGEHSVKKADKSRWHYKLWRFMEDFRYSAASKIWGLLYITIVLLSIFLAATLTASEFREPIAKWENVSLSTLSTSKSGAGVMGKPLLRFQNNTNLLKYLTTEWNHGLQAAELACAVFFTIENVVRFVLCPWKASFCRNWINLLDAACVVVYWISWLCRHLMPQPQEVRFVVLLFILDMALVMRVVRFLKLPSRYNGIRVLYLTLLFCWKELILLQIFVFLGMCTLGFMMFFVEFSFSFSFPDIFAGWWFTGVTMTTVGYGDFVPGSALGKVVAVICALTGAVFLGLPVPIISRRFSDFYTFASLMTKVKKLQLRHKKRLQCQLQNGSRVRSST